MKSIKEGQQKQGLKRGQGEDGNNVDDVLKEYIGQETMMDCEKDEDNSDRGIKPKIIIKETDQDMLGKKANVAIKAKVHSCTHDHKIQHTFSEANCEEDECSLKRQRSEVADLFVKQNEQKDNEHKWKAFTNVGKGYMCMVESDAQECEQIVTDTFLSTPTSLEEGTHRQQ